MVLSDKQALGYIKQPYCGEELDKLKKECKEMRAYVTGKDIKKYMPNISQFERDELRDERQKMLKSPAALIHRNLMPRNRIFSAKGGVEHFIIQDQKKEHEFREYLDNITMGLSLKEWIKQIAIKRNDYDPNGIILIEKDQQKRVYPCFKSVLCIHDRQLYGRTPEYLILKLEPHEIDKLKRNKIIDGRTSSKAEIFRVIDDSLDRLFSRTTKLAEVKSFAAPKFPGRVSSNIFDDCDGIFNSPLHVVKEPIQDYVLWSSLYNVVFARQAFPKEWMQRFACPTCEGVGVMDGMRCPECKGTKVLLSLKHSDVALVDWGDENNKNIPNPPMGSVPAEVETLKAFSDVLEYQDDKIHFGLWGMFKNDTSKSNGGVQRDSTGGSSIEPTAYQAALNNQPMVTQLVEVPSKWYVDIYKFVCDWCGVVTLGKGVYKGSSILAGDRFMIESPDATWDRYLKAVKSEAPYSELDSILIEYIENKYCNNPLLYRKYMLLLGVEPFLHTPIDKVLEFDIPLVQKLEKIYFDEWKTSMTDWEFNVIADGLDTTEDLISEDDSVVESEEEEEGEGGDLKGKNNPIKNLKDSLRKYVIEKSRDDAGLEKPKVTQGGVSIPLNSEMILVEEGQGAKQPSKNGSKK